MQDQYRAFIFLLVFIITAPLVWFFFDLGTAIIASLIITSIVEIIVAGIVFFYRIGTQTDNRDDLIVALVLLALILLFVFVL